MRAALLMVACLILAGCASTNSVTIASQGMSAGSESRSLDCGETGTISLGIQGAGKISVKVTDGDGATIYDKSDLSAGQDGESKTLEGAEGSWTLTVSKGAGFAGQFGIVLTC